MAVEPEAPKAIGGEEERDVDGEIGLGRHAPDERSAEQDVVVPAAGLEAAVDEAERPEGAGQKVEPAAVAG